MDTPTSVFVLLLVLAVVVVAMLAGVFVRSTRGRRHSRLRERFGPEYDRVVEAEGSVTRAERELHARKQRVQERHIRSLSNDERNRFELSWKSVQTRFVDDPPGAIWSADELIQEIMRARGYESGDFERRVEDLSVDHAYVIEHYRAAAALAAANREGRATTEELRQAVVHYRTLVADLLDEPSSSPLHQPREVHA